jgi:hypothetical protein
MNSASGMWPASPKLFVVSVGSVLSFFIHVNPVSCLCIPYSATGSLRVPWANCEPAKPSVSDERCLAPATFTAGSLARVRVFQQAQRLLDVGVLGVEFLGL